MTDQPEKDLEEVIRKDGRYPLEAFAFLHEGLARAVKQIYGDEADESPPAEEVPVARSRPAGRGTSAGLSCAVGCAMRPLSTGACWRKACSGGGTSTPPSTLETWCTCSSRTG